MINGFDMQITEVLILFFLKQYLCINVERRNHRKKRKIFKKYRKKSASGY